MDLQKWTIGFILFALFSIALIAFAIEFANDNNSVINVANDAQISGILTNSSVSLTNFGSAAQNQTQSIVNSSLPAGSLTTGSGGALSVAPQDAIPVGKNIIFVGYAKIFGNGGQYSIVFWTFMGIITFITGLMIWKAWIGRQPSD